MRSARDMELYPGVGAALRALREAGYRLVVLTNQPVIARGEASEAEVARIHHRLEWELGKEGAYLDGIYVCPHHPERGYAGERAELELECACRKPATGLCERACAELKLDKTRSWMVGDQTRDIEMARRAGLRCVLVRTGVAGGDGKFAARPTSWRPISPPLRKLSCGTASCGTRQRRRPRLPCDHLAHAACGPAGQGGCRGAAKARGKMRAAIYPQVSTYAAVLMGCGTGKPSSCNPSM